jgi:hypothetical protein
MRTRKQGRKKATGKFKTREELEAYVLKRWKMPRTNAVVIAEEARVNRMTVYRILDQHGLGTGLPVAIDDDAGVDSPDGQQIAP